jgi:hypothetical protein
MLFGYFFIFLYTFEVLNLFTLFPLFPLFSFFNLFNLFTDNLDSLLTFLLINPFLINYTPRYSTLANNNDNNKINPWFITGLTDGDGAFFFTVIKSTTSSIGWGQKY